MAENLPFAVVRGRAMRVTRLDGCGRVVPAECSALATNGFVSVALASRVDEGEEINIKNANGDTCVFEPANPVLNGFGATITFCKVNPQLFAMMTGQDVVYDGAGRAVGFQVNGGKRATDTGFALEVWSGVPGQACAEGGQGSYGYTLIPFLQGGTIGDFTLENAGVTFTVNNANSKEGNAWGQGPYNVVLDETEAPSPLLQPLPTKNHLHMQWTEVAPPEASDQCIASGPPATGATAGSPGTWTPVDSYAPADLTALQAANPTASPSTAWTTGQYVLLGDGSQAHWDGDSWEAGAA